MGRLPKRNNPTALSAEVAPPAAPPEGPAKASKRPRASGLSLASAPVETTAKGASRTTGRSRSAAASGTPKSTEPLRTSGSDELDEGLDLPEERELLTTEIEPSGLTREQQNSEQNIEFERIFAEWKATGDPELRDRLILMHRNLVSYLARRFTDRGEMFEDIIQQGLLGLINALDHFEPAHGARFVTFATPTIVGEIRRYFRDRTATVRVPRRMMELHQLIHAKIEVLTQELNHSPTYSEIARALNINVEDVIEALEVAHALDPISLDDRMPPEMDGSSISIVDQLGAPDPDLQAWSEHAALNAALEKLPLKQRQVLQFAYFDGFSQAEIARKLNVSQMHISRVQRRALATLREMLQEFDV